MTAVRGRDEVGKGIQGTQMTQVGAGRHGFVPGMGRLLTKKLGKCGTVKRNIDLQEIAKIVGAKKAQWIFFGIKDRNT